MEMQTKNAPEANVIAAQEGKKGKWHFHYLKKFKGRLMVLMKAGVYQIISYKNIVKPSVSFKMEKTCREAER